MTNKEVIRYLELIKGYLPDIQSYVPADYFIEKSLEALDHAIGVLKNSVPDVQVGENSAVILGNVPSSNCMAIGCGAKLDREWLNHARCGYGTTVNTPVGPSAGECLEPGCKPIVNSGLSSNPILFRKFERFSDD